MQEYKHGIYSKRKSAELPTPECDLKNGVAVIGTAPVNLASAPSVNQVVVARKKEDADEALGTSMDFEKYTLLHSVYAHFNVHNAAPVVFINVLDPENSNHVEAVAGKELKLAAKTGVIKEDGILLDKIVIFGDGDAFEEGTDYVASFDDNGYVVISATENGAMAALESVNVSYVKLKPSGVTASDIIGGIDENGTRTGMELLDEIYPRTNIIPTIIIAPGFSHDANVATALELKAQLLYDLTNAVAFVDLDSGDDGAKTKEDVKRIKEETVIASRWITPVWPMVNVDGHKMWASSLAAALYQSNTIQSGGIPSSSASNVEANIDGVCLEDGTEIFLTQSQVDNYINAYGVTSFLMLPKWKLWGNNTAAYPASNAPMNRFTKNVMMLNYLENTFKTDYLSSVDRNADRKIIHDIVNSFNLFLNGLTPDHLAGGSIVFDDRENTEEAIASGHLKFRTRYADYSPSEVIENEFEYDITIYENALKGGEE